MLPRRNRVRSGEFKELMGGKTLSTPYFLLKYKAILETSPTKYAVVVSSKISKRAVERNKIRRRLYSILSKNFPSKGLVGAFFVKKEALKATFKELEKEVGNALAGLSKQR